MGDTIDRWKMLEIRRFVVPMDTLHELGYEVTLKKRGGIRVDLPSEDGYMDGEMQGDNLLVTDLHFFGVGSRHVYWTDLQEKILPVSTGYMKAKLQWDHGDVEFIECTDGEILTWTEEF